MKGNFGKRIIGFVLFGGLLLLGLSWIVKELWNFAAAPALGFNQINYWQAMALLALSKILFTGIHPRGAKNHRQERWRKWREMSPEDREAFKERWKRHHDKK